MDKLKGLDLEEKLVLDAGTGGCNMTRYLSEWGAEVISVDYRPDWQKQCRDIIDKTQFITADLGNMPFFKSEIFDYVICNFVVSALSESKSLLISSPLREFYRILKKNGMLVVIDYQPFIKDVSSCKLDDVQIELWKLENAVSELLGEGHLQEYSSQVLEQELLAIGFSETDTSILLDEVKWPFDLIKEHEERIRNDIDNLKEDYLKISLNKKLDDIIKKAKDKTIKSGQIYELRAVK